MRKSTSGNLRYFEIKREKKHKLISIWLETVKKRRERKKTHKISKQVNNR